MSKLLTLPTKLLILKCLASQLMAPQSVSSISQKPGCCVCSVASVVSNSLSNPMDHSPPSSSAHEILQARILEWVVIPPPGDLPDPGIKLASLTSPALAGRFFTTSTTQETQQSCLICLITLSSFPKYWTCS